jgi:hypothetical protein
VDEIVDNQVIKLNQMRNLRIYSLRAAKVLIALLAFLQVYSWGSSWYFYDAHRSATTVYTCFFLALHGQKYDEAYALTSPAYRETKTLKEFENRFRDLGIAGYALSPDSVVKIGLARKSAIVCPSTEGLMVIGPCYEMIRFGNDWWMTGEISSWSFD